MKHPARWPGAVDPGVAAGASKGAPPAPAEPGSRSGSGSGERGERALVVRCADWPVAAAGLAPTDPVVVLHANRVVAASPAARRHDVTLGLRRREAQARCPDAVVLAPDPASEARAFEPVAARLEALTPRVEVLVPGRATFTTRGPARYFGGDRSLATLTRETVADVLATSGIATSVTIGIADGAFAAGLAAAAAVRNGAGEGVRVVAAGTSAAFLAPLPITTLATVLDGGAELVDVWARLGLTTLGELAGLPAADVLARFGVQGALGHRLAAGLDVRPIDARRPAPEHTVAAELDPPAERVDAAAFVAKALAERLHEQLAANGLACTRVVIGAETEHGERLERVWRHEGTLTAAAIAERTRWQLDGWLTGSSAHRPTSGITKLVLAPDDVVPARGRQLGFWGGETRVDDRVVRALARVQGLLGADAVRVAERRGGRSPAEQVATVPVASVDLTEARPRARASSVTEPWPGQVPVPAPATVHDPARPAVVVDRRQEAVGVSSRATATGSPDRVSIEGGPWRQVVSWAGPWPVEERWWDPAAHRRRARFQVVTDDGTAFLLSLERGSWWVEATYE